MERTVSPRIYVSEARAKPTMWILWDSGAGTWVISQDPHLSLQAETKSPMSQRRAGSEGISAYLSAYLPAPYLRLGPGEQEITGTKSPLPLPLLLPPIHTCHCLYLAWHQITADSLKPAQVPPVLPSIHHAAANVELLKLLGSCHSSALPLKWHPLSP